MDGSTLRLCRRMAKLSLEKAAEHLNICTKSLWNYEHNKRDVPPDVMLQMVQVYHAEFLLEDVCKHCIIGQARGRPAKCAKKKTRHLRCLVS